MRKLTLLSLISLISLFALLASPAVAQRASQVEAPWQPGASRLDTVVGLARLRVCTPGDYRPFSLQRADGGYEGLDIDLVQSAARTLGAEVEYVKVTWPSLMKDFVEKCDVAVGGISVTLERQRTAFFTTAYMVNGKAPITRCENVARFQTLADIDRPGVTVVENPGGSNERYARNNFRQARIVIHDDNTTIFDELLAGRADVMISESVEVLVQQKLHPGLCAVNPERPLQYGEMAWLLPRGDAVFKAWFDQWLHLARAGGDFERITARWLR